MIRNELREKDNDIKAVLDKRYRYSDGEARSLVFKANRDIFNEWDESLGDKDALLNGSKVYSVAFKTDSHNNYTLETDCINADCAEVAENMVKEGLNVAILNLASAYSPGGGYHRGTSAQEESLCQTSTLSVSLYQFGDPKQSHIASYNIANKGCAYPLDLNHGGIYSPGVVFFRNGKKKDYALRDNTFSCSIITVASLSNRDSNTYTNNQRQYFKDDGYMTDEGREIESNKIRTIYRIAIENGIDSLVLGAFGCGVFHLLPIEVAQLFYDILNEDEFKCNFKKVVFAILERGKRGDPIGEVGKFKPFYDLFKK